MKIPDAEQRQCTNCLNPYPLNLFRVDGNVCRYCENGITAHPKLYETIQSQKRLEVPIANKKEALKHIGIENTIKEPQTSLEKPSKDSIEMEDTIRALNDDQDIKEPNSDEDK